MREREFERARAKPRLPWRAGHLQGSDAATTGGQAISCGAASVDAPEGRPSPGLPAWMRAPQLMYADEAYEAPWLPYPRPQCDGRPDELPACDTPTTCGNAAGTRRPPVRLSARAQWGTSTTSYNSRGISRAGPPPHNNMNMITYGKVALSGARCSDGLSGARQRIHTWGDRVHYCVLMTISREHCGPTT